MKDFIESLKIPKNIDIGQIRKYNPSTPSVTGLLSLIDSYELNNTEALDRGTYVHKFIETMLNEKPIIKTSIFLKYRQYIVSFLPYLYLFKPCKDESILLEKKISIDGVFGGTIDYIKVIQDNQCILKDYKTSTSLKSPTGFLKEKYELQLQMYKELVYIGLRLSTLLKELFIITPEGCLNVGTKPSNNPYSPYSNDVWKIHTLILYYHGLNKTHLSDNICNYYSNNMSAISNLSSLLGGYNGNSEQGKILTDTLNELITKLNTYKKNKKA